MLVGYWADDHTAVVTTATGAGPNAIHRRGGFTPDAAYDVAEVARLYEESGRYYVYLGDWHTHPVGGLSPSRRDRRTLRRISRHGDARCPRPVMLIAAGPRDWHVGAWRGRLHRRRLHIDQLRPESYADGW